MKRVLKGVARIRGEIHVGKGHGVDETIVLATPHNVGLEVRLPLIAKAEVRQAARRQVLEACIDAPTSFLEI